MQKNICAVRTVLKYGAFHIKIKHETSDYKSSTVK